MRSISKNLILKKISYLMYFLKDARYSFFITRYLLRGITSGMFSPVKYLYLNYLGLDKRAIGLIASLSSITSSCGKVMAGVFPPKRKMFIISLIYGIIAIAFLFMAISSSILGSVLSLVIIALLYGLEYVYLNSLMMSSLKPDTFITFYSTVITLWSLASCFATIIAGFMIDAYGFKSILLTVSFVLIILSLVTHYYGFHYKTYFQSAVSKKGKDRVTFRKRFSIALSYKPYIFYEISTLSRSFAAAMAIPYVYIFLFEISNSYRVITMLASLYPALSLITTAVQPMVGRLVKKISAFRGLTLSFIFFSLYYFILSLINDAFYYLICLFFLCLAILLNNVSIMSFLNELLRNKEKDIYLGISGSISPIPSMAGPIVGGLLINYLKLRGLFLLSALTCAFSLIPLNIAKNLCKMEETSVIEQDSCNG